MWQSHIQHVVNWPRDNKPPLYPWHLKWLRVGWDITHCKEKTYSSFGMECCATGKQFSKGHHGRMKAGFKRSPKSFLNLSDPQPAASWLCVRQHSVWAVRRFGLRLARKLRGHLDIFFFFFGQKSVISFAQTPGLMNSWLIFSSKLQNHLCPWALWRYHLRILTTHSDPIPHSRSYLYRQSSPELRFWVFLIQGKKKSA